MELLFFAMGVAGLIIGLCYAVSRELRKNPPTQRRPSRKPSDIGVPREYSAHWQRIADAERRRDLSLSQVRHDA